MSTTPAPAAATALVTRTPRTLWVWTATAALASFLFGYTSAVISGANLFIRDDLHLGTVAQSALVSLFLAGAAAGALTAGRLADRLGRRRTFLAVGVLFLAGTVLAFTAPGLTVLLVGRSIQGAAAGIGSALVPMYLAELAPARIRGRLVSVNQLLLTLGLLAAFLVDWALSGSGDWRLMFAVALVPALLLLLGLARLPESPSWLAARGRTSAARAVLERIQSREQADAVLTGLHAARAERADGPKGLRSLTGRAVKRAVVVGVALAVLQQFVGINAVMYFAPTVMKGTGLNASNSIAYSVAIGVINVIATVVAMTLVDRWGRRPLLLVSLAGMFIALVPLGATFVWHLPASHVIALVALLGYVVAFAIGMGPVFWLLASEIFPPSVRATGMGLSTTVVWISNLLVGQFFLSVAAGIGQGETFWLFAVACVLGFVFVRRRVPETKGRNAAQIQAALT
ncbi:sugar porter family MFS transporter [Streptomyces sp. NPDC057011]|uniref:sugar porter family MFS transporter n=1 Tax=unclassified Streptomyces TaxID=2593676 RepID=UPI003637E764